MLCRTLPFEKIETALEPDFQQLFINAMALPNKVDAFPKLAAEVKLPPRKVLAEGDGGDGGPRRRSREGRPSRRTRD